ncbi:hypothetical protein JOB18_030921 [Scomber scombrus]|uniref:Uncharacterized protein n=1 Tax=Scomber scombrus TaxID=13677 RepID=A0AAV1NTC7_SCOSC
MVKVSNSTSSKNTLQRSRRCVMYRKRWVKCRLEINTPIGKRQQQQRSRCIDRRISRMFDCKSIHICFN